MKKYLISSALLLSTAFFVGCGNSGSSVSDEEFNYDTSSIFGFSKDLTYKDYVVKAEDDPIIHATVKATNCGDFEEIGNGEYLLKKCVGKPMLIEVKNGEIKDKNVSQDFPLILNVAKINQEDGFVVTPLTTILADANDSEAEELATKLGVSKEDLFSTNNEKVKKLFPKVNAVLIQAAAQGAITNKIKFLDTVRKSVIENVENDDVNITKVLDDVKQKSQQNPNMFGLVVVDTNNIDNSDPLETLAKMQNSKNIKFYGLVFDKIINDANVTVKDLDTNLTYNIKAISQENGNWSFEVDENESEGSLYDTIMNKNHLLQFTAIKDKIKLTSTITTQSLRNLIKESKIVSPTKDNSLIISNVTTAQDAILDKKGALNSSNYDGNISELRVYYQDKVIKAAALVKAVVDENASMDADNTYDLVKNSIVNENNANIDINTSSVDSNISKLEENITNDTILSSQLNNVQVENGEKNGFEEIAKNNGYVFYRVLAYYKENEPKTDDNFVREYTKFIVYPGYYETKTCYLEGNSTGDWNCDEPQIIQNSSNFTLGQYEIDKNDTIINYNLDFNSTVYVSALNKSYNYYGVIKSDTNLTSGITSTEPMILVSSYDVVDAIRRIPTFENGEDFEKLKELVINYNSKEEVNFALNRWIKDYMNKIQDYFEQQN